MNLPKISAALLCVLVINLSEAITITKVVTMSDSTVLPNTVRFTTTVTSPDPVASVQLNDGSLQFDVYWNVNMTGPSVSSPDVTITNSKLITWTKGISATTPMVLSYLAVPTNKGKTFPTGISYYPASVSYRNDANVLTTINATCCISRVDQVEKSIFYDYGLTAAAAVCGFIAGIGIAVLILFIIFKVRRQVPFGSVSPATENNKNTTAPYERYRTSIDMTANDRNYNENVTVVDLSTEGTFGNVFQVFNKKGKYFVEREVSSVDIIDTNRAEIILVNEFDKALEIVAKRSMHRYVNAKHDNENDEMSLKHLDKNISEMSNKLQQESNVKCAEISSVARVKNRERCNRLADSQKRDQALILELVENMPKDKRNEITAELETLFTLEENELNYALKLDKLTQLEENRKNCAVHKHGQLMDILQTWMHSFLASARDDRRFESEIRATVSQGRQSIAQLTALYEDKVNIVRAALDGRLAFWQRLHREKETREEQQRNVLNALAAQHVELITAARSDKVLTAKQARLMTEETMHNLEGVRQRCDDESDKQWKLIQDRLGEAKRDKMAAALKKHEQRLAESDRQSFGKGEGHKLDVDDDGGLGKVAERLSLICQLQCELIECESQIDSEDFVQLIQLLAERSKITVEELNEEKQNLITALEARGMGGGALKKLLARQKRDFSELVSEQETALDSKLAEMERHIDNAAKKHATLLDANGELADVFEFEQKVFGRLLSNLTTQSLSGGGSQMADKHLSRLVQQQSGATLTKLRLRLATEGEFQRERQEKLSALEKKLAAFAKKQKQQRKQSAKERRKKRSRDSESDDGAGDKSDAEQDSKTVDFLEKYLKTRRAVLDGTEFDFDTAGATAQISAHVTKQTVDRLKEAEVTLARNLARQQLNSAYVVNLSRDVEKAVHTLNVCLVESLVECRAMSEREAEDLLDKHLRALRDDEARLEDERQRQVDDIQQTRSAEWTQESNLLQLQHQQEADGTINVANAFDAKFRLLDALHDHVRRLDLSGKRAALLTSQLVQECHVTGDAQRCELFTRHALDLCSRLVGMGHVGSEDVKNCLYLIIPTLQTADCNRVLGLVYQHQQHLASTSLQLSKTATSRRQPQLQQQQQQAVVNLQQKVLQNLILPRRQLSHEI
jgi:hypothetical protein